FPELPDQTLWIVIGGAMLLLFLGCGWVARGKFEHPDRSLVRLEASMELRNALSAASAGVAPWPAPMAKPDAGVRWHWPRLVVPPVAAALLLAAGILIPVSSAPPPAPKEKPQAWRQLESSLEHLTKEELADEK